MLLDIFYIGVVIAFFVLLWGFTKSLRASLGGFDGIRHRRNRRGMSVCLLDVCVNSPGTVLRC